MFGLKNIIRRNLGIARSAPEEVFNQYSRDVPKHQNAVDTLSGWNSAFPPGSGVEAGSHPLFADGRINWAIDQAGPLSDKKIIEIGPLEGMHTYMLNQHRPARIDAIEANKQCFLRCLVTKEILNIDRAKFYLGDALRWLQETKHHYDLAIASGVLYHMADPADFLLQLADHCENLFLWTHYFDEDAMAPSDSRRLAFSGKVESRTIAGLTLHYYERSYFNAQENDMFCGGMKDRHYWMRRDDIIELLAVLGFSDIVVAHDDPAHGGGPCFSLFAKRSR